MPTEPGNKLVVAISSRALFDLDESHEIVICTMHGAKFRASDGECIFGPCKGQRLQPVVIRIEGDEIILPDGA